MSRTVSMGVAHMANTDMALMKDMVPASRVDTGTASTYMVNTDMVSTGVANTGTVNIRERECEDSFRRMMVPQQKTQWRL